MPTIISTASKAAPIVPKQKEQIKPLILPAKYQPRMVMPPFLHVLPGELRNRIYELIGFRQTKRIDLASSPEKDIARVVHLWPMLRNEINSFVFADCTFEVEVISRFVVFPGARSHEMTGTTHPARYMDAGKLVLPHNHWAKQQGIGVKFLKITFLVKETRGSLIARVHFIARPAREVGPGKPPATMIVRDIGSVNVKKSVAIMTTQARRLVLQYSKAPDFTGFTMSQLEKIANCYMWKLEDLAAENTRLRLQTEKLSREARYRS